MPTWGGPPLTPDEERQVEQVMIASTLHPSKDISPHDPDNHPEGEYMQECDLCGACMCEEGDHRLDCSDYIH